MIELTCAGSQSRRHQRRQPMADHFPTLGSRIPLVLVTAITFACNRPGAGPDGPKAIRLVDGFDAKLVEGSPGKPAAAPPRTEWRFDGAPPRAASPPPGPAPSPAP